MRGHDGARGDEMWVAWSYCELRAIHYTEKIAGKGCGDEVGVHRQVITPMRASFSRAGSHFVGSGAYAYFEHELGSAVEPQLPEGVVNWVRVQQQARSGVDRATRPRVNWPCGGRLGNSQIRGDVGGVNVVAGDDDGDHKC